MIATEKELARLEKLRDALETKRRSISNQLIEVQHKIGMIKHALEVMPEREPERVRYTAGTCPWCGGTGGDPSGTTKCRECHGKGKL